MLGSRLRLLSVRCLSTTRSEGQVSSLRTLAKATLIGRLGTQPEVKNWDNGRQSLELSVAVNSREADAELTQWHKVFVRDDTLGFDYLARARKGALVYVEGALKVVRREHPDFGKAQYVNVTVSRSSGGTVRVLDGQVDWEELDRNPEEPF